MILSGACCGDKFSPLSDSTNLAAASAQTGLFDHVRAMTTTTFPSLLIAIVLYAFFSISHSGNYDPPVYYTHLDVYKRQGQHDIQ